MKAKDIALVLVVVVLVAFTPNSPISVLARDVLADARPAPLSAGPVGTAFTYQGQLTDGGVPADGVYDFQFTLWDAETSGVQIGSLVTRGDIVVAGGIFAVELDFGAGAFVGEARWLEIGVRPGDSSGSYTTLDPRQKVTPTPYALYAANVDTLDGQHGSAFALAAHNHLGQIWSGSGPGLSVISSNANALYASSTAGSGLTYGVYGTSNSTSGNGVVGWATAPSGSTVGVVGRSDSPAGYGVKGYTTSATGGTGVFGEANATSGSATGVQGISHATDGGAGVYGIGAATGNTYGVYGWSQSTGGTGVTGYATASTGYTNGVRGRSDSTSGWGGYFDGLGNGVLAIAPASGNIFEGRQYPSDAVKFSVSGAGNVHSYGTVTADGNVITGGSFHYATPRTRVISIPWEAFLPTTHDQPYEMNWGAYIESGTYGLVAPVQLPQGAIITQVKFWYSDYHAASNLGARLLRYQGDTNSVDLLAELWSTGSAGNGSVSTTAISNATVDNATSDYWLTVVPDLYWYNADLRVRGVAIWYTEADAE